MANISGAVGAGSDTVIVQPSVAAGPSGKILAVWRERTGTVNTAYFSEGTSAGQWSASKQLTQIGQFDPVASDTLAIDTLSTGFALRMNASGDAVLGWTEPLPGKIATWFNHKSRILRYAHDTGWSPSATDMLSPVTIFTGEANNSDLQILDDGRITFSDYIPNVPTVQIYRQSGNAAPNAIAALANSSQANYQGFASDSAGNAVAVYADGNLNTFDLNISSAISQPAKNIHSSVFGGSCGSNPWRSPNVAIGNARYSIYTYTVIDPAVKTCSLRLATRDAVTGQISYTPDMTPASFILQPPILAMDKTGNGVVVWEELSGDLLQPSGRPVFADALPGNALSPPQLLGSNYESIGKKIHNIPLRFAMNRAGKGVAAMVVYANGNAYLATSLYSAQAGFSPWKLVAGAYTLGVPNVAISEAGDAFVTWAAPVNCKRTAPALALSCDDKQQAIYVLKL
ncbi:MAG: hypothetical protein WBD81_15220 [Collimonas pratensis]|uniref:hypothetical protein n=1 Tax=Collimonas pratensis TaxID=279113 RepID=UPI003C77B65D